MKTASIILIILGALYLVSNLRDQIRGTTSISVTMPYPSAPSVEGEASLDRPTSNFDGAMIYNWLYACGLVGLGVVGLCIHNHHERLDPLSPAFDPDSATSNISTRGKEN